MAGLSDFFFGTNTTPYDTSMTNFGLGIDNAFDGTPSVKDYTYVDPNLGAGLAGTVFDGSNTTNTGYNFNDLLGLGKAGLGFLTDNAAGLGALGSAYNAFTSPQSAKDYLNMVSQQNALNYGLAKDTLAQTGAYQQGQLANQAFANQTQAQNVANNFTLGLMPFQQKLNVSNAMNQGFGLSKLGGGLSQPAAQAVTPSAPMTQSAPTNIGLSAQTAQAPVMNEATRASIEGRYGSWLADQKARGLSNIPQVQSTVFDALGNEVLFNPATMGNGAGDIQGNLRFAGGYSQGTMDPTKRSSNNYLMPYLMDAQGNATLGGGYNPTLRPEDIAGINQRGLAAGINMPAITQQLMTPQAQEATKARYPQYYGV